MLDTSLIIVCIVMLGATLAVLLKLLARPAVPATSPELLAKLEAMQQVQARAESAMREELSRNRQESGDTARQLREEVNTAITQLITSTRDQIVAFGQFQTAQLEQFSKQLGTLTQTSEHKLDAARTATAQQFTSFGQTLADSIKSLVEANEKRFETLRASLDQRLKELQDGNEKKLEQMRATVDEKLQSTLNQRLTESFKSVSERLQAVHEGLGEMRTLASGVGDLKKVLTNVKTRGNWGEIQLKSLLDQILTPEQYAENVSTTDSAERVEFVIKLPGKSGSTSDAVMLPIDAKFPVEDYQRLVEAQEAADPVAADAAIRQLEQRVKGCAKDICSKYLNPPRTTDFGIMFLPTEGLYAEVIRRTGLVEQIQRECRVVIAGPTTLAALLNSLQMGFRTLAIEKRSSEVWELLGGVKTEFGKFSDVMAKVQKKLQAATNEIDEVAKRTRVINRKLKGVQELSVDSSQKLLDLAGLEIEADSEDETSVLPS